MKKITDHKLPGLNESLEVTAVDAPGYGNAHHVYQIDLLVENSKLDLLEIKFQNGPINEIGFNGISNEALLAVVIDRLRGFQGGEFKCRENALALTAFEEGLMWLQKRTRDRMYRGVEGTHQK